MTSVLTPQTKTTSFGGAFLLAKFKKFEGDARPTSADTMEEAALMERGPELGLYSFLVWGLSGSEVFFFTSSLFWSQ